MVLKLKLKFRIDRYKLQLFLLVVSLSHVVFFKHVVLFSYKMIHETEILYRPKSKEDLLYQVPENINVKSKIMASEEMLSNQMLSGIPEVDLGIEAKILNIEATEEAKQRVLEEQRNKKSRGPTEMVPTNMAVNFMLHSRCKFPFVKWNLTVFSNV